MPSSHIQYVTATVRYQYGDYWRQNLICGISYDLFELPSTPNTSTPCSKQYQFRVSSDYGHEPFRNDTILKFWIIDACLGVQFLRYGGEELKVTWEKCNAGYLTSRSVNTVEEDFIEDKNGILVITGKGMEEPLLFYVEGLSELRGM